MALGQHLESEVAFLVVVVSVVFAVSLVSSIAVADLASCACWALYHRPSGGVSLE